MRGNPHVRFGPGAVGKGPATSAGTSPTAYRCTLVVAQGGIRAPDTAKSYHCG